MDQNTVLRQVLQFNKTAFDNSFNALVMLQEQAEKATRMMLDQAPWVPEAGRSTIEEWVNSYSRGRNDFKKQMDESFQKLEAQFKSDD